MKVEIDLAAKVDFRDGGQLAKVIFRYMFVKGDIMRFCFCGVKLKAFTVCFLTVIMCAAVMCGCKRISEDVYVVEETSYTAYETSETSDTEKTETVMSEEMLSSETTLQNETEETSSEVASETTAETATESETAVVTSAEETTSETTAPKTTTSEAETTTMQTTQTETDTEPIETAAVTVVKVPIFTEVDPAETELVTSFVQETAAPVETASPSVYGVNYYSALNYGEQKGIWISYLEYDSIMKNKSAESFRKSVGECFDNVRSLDFNTVYVQVRAHGDAYYDSELFPSGDRFDGTMGTSSDYDALQIMIEEAHSRGLSVHAWINPMRLMTDSQIAALSDSFKIKQWYDSAEKNGSYIVKYSGRWYLNPAYSEVVQLIADGITEIVANYDVDGVQIDDYFYPTTDKSFDSVAYSGSGTSLSLSDWRESNVNAMVKKLYKAVHNANSTAVFGISPQGSIANNYNQLYADVRSWCSEWGYCDYILPQIYFGFENATLPYCDTVSEWDSMISGNVKLVVGLAGYKSGAEDSYAGEKGKSEWINNSDILARQMSFASEAKNYGGVALFRYDSLFKPSASVSKQVSLEVENIKKIQ